MEQQGRMASTIEASGSFIAALEINGVAVNMTVPCTSCLGGLDGAEGLVVDGCGDGGAVGQRDVEDGAGRGVRRR